MQAADGCIIDTLRDRNSTSTVAVTANLRYVDCGLIWGWTRIREVASWQMRWEGMWAIVSPSKFGAVKECRKNPRLFCREIFAQKCDICGWETLVSQKFKKKKILSVENLQCLSGNSNFFFGLLLTHLASGICGHDTAVIQLVRRRMEENRLIKNAAFDIAYRAYGRRHVKTREVKSYATCVTNTIQYNTMKNLHSKTDKHTVSLI